MTFQQSSTQTRSKYLESGAIFRITYRLAIKINATEINWSKTKTVNEYLSSKFVRQLRTVAMLATHDMPTRFVFK